MKLTFTNLSAHGVTLPEGQRLVGIDQQLVERFTAAGCRTVVDLAREAQRLADHAIDASDTDGTEPGELHFAVFNFVDETGSTRIDVTFEQVGRFAGFVAFCPQIVDDHEVSDRCG